MAAAEATTTAVAVPVEKMSSSQRTINNLGYQVFMVGISLLALFGVENRCAKQCFLALLRHCIQALRLAYGRLGHGIFRWDI